MFLNNELTSLSKCFRSALQWLEDFACLETIH